MDCQAISVSLPISRSCELCHDWLDIFWWYCSFVFWCCSLHVPLLSCSALRLAIEEICCGLIIWECSVQCIRFPVYPIEHENFDVPGTIQSAVLAYAMMISNKLETQFSSSQWWTSVTYVVDDSSSQRSCAQVKISSYYKSPQAGHSWRRYSRCACQA